MAPSWLYIPPASPFSLSNIPFGICSTFAAPLPRPCVAIGDHVLNLSVFASAQGFRGLPLPQDQLAVFYEPTLNAFAALGREFHRRVREYLQEVFAANTPWPEILKDDHKLRQDALGRRQDITKFYLPMSIGNYTDFFAGKNHAVNTNTIFRGAGTPLPPNYTHLPVGYHGRASSVVVSGISIRRPWGQILRDAEATPKVPEFAPSRKLDFELELAAFVCKSNHLGEPVPIGEAEDHIFGFVLMNDLSARDIQAWEYVPLGPFTSKSFATVISPWVVLADALEPHLTRGFAAGDRHELLPYLRECADNVYDLELSVALIAEGRTTTICRSNAKNLLFSFPQMLAHHTVTGCNMQVGDLIGSGTISGAERGSFGSMVEQSQNGKMDIVLNGNCKRRFLEDGDIVVFNGSAGAEGNYVGFGECVVGIRKALDLATS